MEQHLALYRKWRPLTFDDVFGQEHVTTALRNQVAAGRTSHAYLFTGTRGTGKTSCAKILARAVCCEHPINGSPCNQCAACRSILEDSALDVSEIVAASNNRVATSGKRPPFLPPPSPSVFTSSTRCICCLPALSMPC